MTIDCVEVDCRYNGRIDFQRPALGPLCTRPSTPFMTPTRKGKRRIVTLKQVAELAGVHASTVSRALNPSTRSMVMPAVVERVVKAANNLGYRPDPVAASLRTGRSALVGILVPDIANTVFAPILSGASERLSAQGYSVILADVGNDESKQIDLVTGLMARRVDGLILASAATTLSSPTASSRICRRCWSTAPRRNRACRPWCPMIRSA